LFPDPDSIYFHPSAACAELHPRFLCDLWRGRGQSGVETTTLGGNFHGQSGVETTTLGGNFCKTPPNPWDKIATKEHEDEMIRVKECRQGRHGFESQDGVRGR